MINHEKIARSILEGLRESYGLERVFIHDLDWLRSEVQQANLSMSDIGTDEQELDKFLICGLKCNARIRLIHLRDSKFNHNESYKHCLDDLVGYIEEGKFPLADVGTSEEEIRGFRIKSLRLLLDFARQLNNEEKSCGMIIPIIQDRLAEENITLQEIGTTKEEITALVDKSQKLVLQDINSRREENLKKI